MTEPFRFPNESDDYRRARDELLEREIELRAQIEAVAAQRRALPRGGRLGEQYRLRRCEGGDVREVPFAELFGRHDNLLIYTMMFGEQWDAPCPSCTSIVAAIDSSWYAVDETCAIAVVAAAVPEHLAEWGRRRGWTVPLYSAQGSRFALDYAGFATDDPGLVSILNAFVRDDDGIFHTWGSELLSRPMASGHPRHVDNIWPLWNLLDQTARGRGEAMVPRQDFEHAYFTRHVLGQEPDDGSCC